MNSETAYIHITETIVKTIDEGHIIAMMIIIS